MTAYLKRVASEAFGVVVSPGATFREASAPYSWLLLGALSLLLSTVGTFVIWSSPRANTFLDNQVARAISNFQQQFPNYKKMDEAQQRIQQSRIPPYDQAKYRVRLLAVQTLILSGFFWVVCSVFLARAGIPFRSVLRVFVLSLVVVAIGDVAHAILASVGLADPISPFHVPVPVASEGQHPWLHALEGLDLFSLWWVVVSGIGLAATFDVPLGAFLLPWTVLYVLYRFLPAVMSLFHFNISHPV